MKKSGSTRRPGPPQAFHSWTLGHRVALETLISDLSASLVDLPAGAAEKRIHRAFEEMLEFFRLDRVSLWEFSQDRSQMILLHSRHSKGTPSAPARVSARDYDWTASRLLRGESILVHGPHQLPEAASAVKEFLSQQGIRSWMALPLRREGAVFGALVFVSLRREIHWDRRVIARLQTVADIFGSALARYRAEQALRQSEVLKTSVLNSMESQVIVVDREGVVLATNREVADFCPAQSCSECVKVGADHLAELHRCAQPGNTTVQDIVNGVQAVLRGARPIAELEYQVQSGARQRWFSTTVTPLTGSERGAVIVHRDITSRKRAESELRESEDRFRKLADEAPVMMWTRDAEGDFIHVNQYGLEMTGWRAEDFTLSKWMAAIHPDDLQKNFTVWAQAMDARQKYMLEYRYRHASGQYRWLLACGMPRYLADGSFAGYVGIGVDIQDKKEAEQARQELAGRLLRAQEEERARIARELHDDIAQRLALLTIRLGQLEKEASLAEDAERVADLRRQAKQLSLDVSHLSHLLHSSYLENLGLAAAVENQCREAAKLHHLEIECKVRDLPRMFDHDVALSLFRVLQEALRNIIRHSHADKVQVDLLADAAGIHLRVSDDGVGFDPAAPGNREGLGLVSMRERLRLVGGSLTVTSQPGRGTRVEARAPLAHLDRHAPAHAPDILEKAG
ncbi:MAG TPA: PAS domain S-box protein [Terriglobales bacterium]|nr:PAS domain S-box protein [Terriglobales bacterium]